MATMTRTSAISWPTTIFSEKPSFHCDRVRVCGMEDYKACARSLAEAFYDDDVAFYFLDVPDNGGKTREQLWPLHLEILEYIVCAHIHNGLVLSIGENHEGVALWYVACPTSVYLSLALPHNSLPLFLPLLNSRGDAPPRLKKEKKRKKKCWRGMD